MRNLFLNVTAHKLSKEQLEEARKVLNADVVDIVDYKSDNERLLESIQKIVPKLRQSPSDEQELFGIADEFLDIIKVIAFEKDRKIFVHLPVGSPAQMFYISVMWEERLKFLGRVYPVFSHTVREVVERSLENGTVEKVSLFRFEKYIIPFSK